MKLFSRLRHGLRFRMHIPLLTLFRFYISRWTFVLIKLRYLGVKLCSLSIIAYFSAFLLCSVNYLNYIGWFLSPVFFFSM